MDDEAAIRALIGAYAELLDAGDFDGVAALFEHAEVRTAWAKAARVGAAAVRQMYDPVVVYDDGTPRTKHILANIIVDVDHGATTATAQCTFTVMQAVAGGPLRAVLAGRYLDRFVRDPDAGWRFAARTIHPDLVGDLARHMAR